MAHPKQVSWRFATSLDKYENNNKMMWRNINGLDKKSLKTGNLLNFFARWTIFNAIKANINVHKEVLNATSAYTYR